MEDLFALVGLYTVTIRANFSAAGTSHENLYYHATVTAENDLTKLTGRGSASGKRGDPMGAVQEEAIRAALADVAAQAQALAKAKGYRS